MICNNELTNRKILFPKYSLTGFYITIGILYCPFCIFVFEHGISLYFNVVVTHVNNFLSGEFISCFGPFLAYFSERILGSNRESHVTKLICNMLPVTKLICNISPVTKLICNMSLSACVFSTLHPLLAVL